MLDLSKNVIWNNFVSFATNSDFLILKTLKIQFKFIMGSIVRAYMPTMSIKGKPAKKIFF